VKLGTITLVQNVEEQAAADKSLLFLPASVLSGIEVADPMVTVRSATYPVSYAERQ